MCHDPRAKEPRQFSEESLYGQLAIRRQVSPAAAAAAAYTSTTVYFFALQPAASLPVPALHASSTIPSSGLVDRTAIRRCHDRGIHSVDLYVGRMETRVAGSKFDGSRTSHSLKFELVENY